jgi:hypothetical protein
MICFKLVMACDSSELLSLWWLTHESHAYCLFKGTLTRDFLPLFFSSNNIFEWLWQPLKRISIEKTYIGKLTYTISITFTHKNMGVNLGSFLSQRCHWHRCNEFHSRFSPRIRSHIQKGFKPCIRGLGGVVWWKKPEVKNLVSLQLQNWGKRHHNLLI